MRVPVSGGAGFGASDPVRTLAPPGASAAALANLPRSHRENLDGLARQAVAGGIRGRASARSCAAAAEAIFPSAAPPGNQRAMSGLLNDPPIDVRGAPAIIQAGRPQAVVSSPAGVRGEWPAPAGVRDEWPAPPGVRDEWPAPAGVRDEWPAPPGGNNHPPEPISPSPTVAEVRCAGKMGPGSHFRIDIVPLIGGLRVRKWRLSPVFPTRPSAATGCCGAGKPCAGKQALDYARQFGREAACLRYFTNNRRLRDGAGPSAFREAYCAWRRTRA